LDVDQLFAQLASILGRKKAQCLRDLVDAGLNIQAKVELVDYVLDYKSWLGHLRTKVSGKMHKRWYYTLLKKCLHGHDGPGVYAWYKSTCQDPEWLPRGGVKLFSAPMNPLEYPKLVTPRRPNLAQLKSIVESHRHLLGASETAEAAMKAYITSRTTANGADRSKWKMSECKRVGEPEIQINASPEQVQDVKQEEVTVETVDLNANPQSRDSVVNVAKSDSKDQGDEIRLRTPERPSQFAESARSSSSSSNSSSTGTQQLFLSEPWKPSAYQCWQAWFIQEEREQKSACQECLHMNQQLGQYSTRAVDTPEVAQQKKDDKNKLLQQIKEHLLVCSKPRATMCKGVSPIIDEIVAKSKLPLYLDPKAARTNSLNLWQTAEQNVEARDQDQAEEQKVDYWEYLQEWDDAAQPHVTHGKYELSKEWTWGQHGGKLTPGLFGIMYFVQVTLEKKLAPFKILELTNKRVYIEWLQPDIRPDQEEEPMMRGSYCLYSQRGPLKQKKGKKKGSGPAKQAATGAKGPCC